MEYINDKVFTIFHTQDICSIRFYATEFSRIQAFIIFLQSLDTKFIAIRKPMESEIYKITKITIDVYKADILWYPWTEYFYDTMMPKSFASGILKFSCPSNSKIYDLFKYNNLI